MSTNGDLQSVAIHESAHRLVADEFGLSPQILVTSSEIGVCVSKSGSGFANSCIGWAGVVGEDLANCRHSKRKLPRVALPLRAADLREWHRQMTECGGLDEMSSDDRRSILYHGGLEPVEKVFEILARNLGFLRLDAHMAVTGRNATNPFDRLDRDAFVHRCREQAQKEAQAVAQADFERELDLLATEPPDGFPATFGEFVERVCIGDPWRCATKEDAVKAMQQGATLAGQFIQSRSRSDPEMASTPIASRSEWRFLCATFKDWKAKRAAPI
jgi:hypothetical protein